MPRPDHRFADTRRARLLSARLVLADLLGEGLGGVPPEHDRRARHPPPDVQQARTPRAMLPTRGNWPRSAASGSCGAGWGLEGSFISRLLVRRSGPGPACERLAGAALFSTVESTTAQQSVESSATVIQCNRAMRQAGGPVIMGMCRGRRVFPSAGAADLRRRIGGPASGYQASSCRAVAGWPPSTACPRGADRLGRCDCWPRGPDPGDTTTGASSSPRLSARSMSRWPGCDRAAGARPRSLPGQARGTGHQGRAWPSLSWMVSEATAWVTQEAKRGYLAGL